MIKNLIKKYNLNIKSMKLRNPTTRNHLKIKKKEYVLEVGGGHNPHERSNVIVDKHVDSNYHRSGDIKVYKNQKFIKADGENLPFKDNEFDYVICNQVLEHVENPIEFIKEQTRVAKRGYLETPSLIGECLHPKESHKWLILEIDNKIVLMDKKHVNFNPSNDFGYLFLDFLPTHSIGYKILQYTYANLQTIRYEWEGDIEIIVNPEDGYYTKYFTNVWEQNDINKFLPKRTLTSEVWETMKSMSYIIKTYLKSRLTTR
jgi:SAM-dependent methyltransferase